MRKSFVLIILFLFSSILSFAKPALCVSFAQQNISDTFTNSAWEVSIQAWDCNGSFDYFLYHPNSSSQIMSKVSLPQNQGILVLNIKYALSDDNGFLKLQYGKSGTKIKGRGFDSDWETMNSNTLTDYGELDSYGKQQLFSIDYGKNIINNNNHTISILGGWGKQETTNELRDIVYYLIDGTSYNGRSQDDIGSSLNGELSGFHLGFSSKMHIGLKLTLDTELLIAYLRTKAYGLWNNHTPAWYWTDTGNTIGYIANIGLKYAFNRNISSEIKYRYNYSKSTGCEEVLNDELLPQQVDLEYKQKGLVIGLTYSF